MDKDNSKLVDMIVGFYKGDRRWILIRRTGIAVSFALFLLAGLWNFINANGRMPIWGEYIAVVPIKGEITDSSKASAALVVPALRNAFKDENAKAVVLEIESPGGSPYEAERIYEAINRLRKAYPKPVIAVAETTCASAAYMIAMHADKIVAGRYSTVGSLGVLMKTYNVKELADKLHISQVAFATGPYKLFLDPLSTATEDQKVKAQELVETAGSYFKADIKAKRGTRLKTEDYFTGAVWTGQKALELGLVDEIGSLESIAEGYKLQTANLGPAPGLLAQSSIDLLGSSIARNLHALLFQPVQLR